MRQSLGKDYDPSVFNNPEVRYSMVEQLIGQRVLDQEVRRGNLRVSDAQLAQFIGELPPFQEEIIHRAIELNHVVTSEIMTPRGKIFSLPADMLLEQASARLPSRAAAAAS